MSAVPDAAAIARGRDRVADFQPSARVIADSISDAGHRLTTIEVTMHRYMLPEFNTHRALSRNSASSRAIPFRKTLQKVADSPAIPVTWASECKGMQGGEPLSGPAGHQARSIWLAARDAAVVHAEQLAQLGVHKSIVNRLLEPFLPHTVIASATDWDTFWDQRCSPLAQDDIRTAAEAMKSVYDASTPSPVDPGGWHTPYVSGDEVHAYGVTAACQISAARCARVSYLTHDGVRDPNADVGLYWRLVQADPPHASPLEHVATPNPEGTGNFTGWRQLRHLTLDV